MSREGSQSVLLAIDGSLHADRAANYLARDAAALGIREVIVLYVETLGSHHTHMVDGTEVSLDATELGTEATANACRLLSGAHIPYRLSAVQGDPADAIVQAAHANLVDEVVIGSRGMSQWSGLALGSVAYKVIHRTPLPVTVVVNLSEQASLQFDDRPPVHRLLLAVDGSKHALRAVEYVCNLCRAGAALEIHLVHIPVPIPAAHARGHASQEMVELHILQEGKWALHAAQEMLQASGEEFSTHVVPGDTAQRIVQLAERHNCTRIVMGTRGLGAMAGLVLGSVAYRVIHVSPVPVTLVK